MKSINNEKHKICFRIGFNHFNDLKRIIHER